jgi:hypothetical protein
MALPDGDGADVGAVRAVKGVMAEDRTGDVRAVTTTDPGAKADPFSWFQQNLQAPQSERTGAFLRPDPTGYNMPLLNADNPSITQFNHGCNPN